MKVECTDCHKIYNFNDEKVPDSAFTFGCKQCGGRIRISDEKLTAHRVKMAAKKSAADKVDKPSRAQLAVFEFEKLKNPIEKSVKNTVKKTVEKSTQKSAQLVSEMAQLSEKDWIFKLVKVVSYGSIAFLVTMLVVCGLTYFSIGNASRVTFEEVERSLELKLDPLSKLDAAAPEIKLPGVIKKYFDDEHREIFIDWMNGLDQSQKKKFISDLERIIRTAEEKEPSHVSDYIIEFGNLTFRRTVEKPSAKYFFKFGLIIGMVALFSMLAVFSLILLRMPTRTKSKKDKKSAKKDKKIAKADAKAAKKEKKSAKAKKKSQPKGQIQLGLKRASSASK